MPSERAKKAFIVQLEKNKKRFAFSYDQDRFIVILFGKYKDSSKTVFQVVKTQRYETQIDSKYKDLKDRDTVKEILRPFIEDIIERSEKIKGI
jgi:hypothetical protein